VKTNQFSFALLLALQADADMPIWFFESTGKEGRIRQGVRDQQGEALLWVLALVILSICETSELIIATSATAHEKKKLMLAFGKKKVFGAWSD
jgi:hypothetical protein